jgi:thiamine biosynthesis lipoprotein
MGGMIAVGLLALVAPAAAVAEPAVSRFEFQQVEMAVPIKIVLYAPDSATATRAAKDAFGRLHALNAIMSDYDDQSELRRLCDTSGEGKAVHVSPDLWKVLAHAQQVSARSEGAFDVTVGPVVRLWRRARRQRDLPPPDMLEAARKLVGYRLVRLDPEKRSVELLKKGMRLDLGGIAKGYAMDEALAALSRSGVTRALVEAGGDVRLGDPPPDQPGWRVGITPLDAPMASAVSYLVLSRVAVSTSGDAMQFLDIGGKRYSHVVDPRTGIGLTDHCRVIVVAPEGMAADAITKAVGVLGPEKGMKLIENTPPMAARIDRAPQGKPERYESSRWKELPMVKVRRN